MAAETFLSLANEQPIPATKTTPNFPSNTTLNSSTGTSHPNPAPEIGPLNFLFPHVQGILAYDTPFLGLAPEMIAHGLEGGHKLASSAYNTYNEFSSLFNWGGKDDTATTASAPKASRGALPAPSAAAMADAAASPTWSSWGKYAMFAGAAGAVVAGGAAAYSQREKLSAGWSWAGSHLLFIGDLAKAERLRQRVENINKQCVERGIGAANLYSNLGRGAREGYGVTETLAGRDRTFCNLPTSIKEGRVSKKAAPPRMQWIKTVNDKAKDETTAHTTMFYPKENPGFYALGEASKEIIASWIDQGWYSTSTVKTDKDHSRNTVDPGSIGKDWEGVDEKAGHDDNDDGLQMRDEESENTADPDMAMLEGSVIVDKSPANSTTLKRKAPKLPKVKSRGPGLQMRDEDSENMTDPDTAMLEGIVIDDKSPVSSTISKRKAPKLSPIRSRAENKLDSSTAMSKDNDTVDKSPGDSTTSRRKPPKLPPVKSRADEATDSDATMPEDSMMVDRSPRNSIASRRRAPKLSIKNRGEEMTDSDASVFEDNFVVDASPRSSIDSKRRAPKLPPKVKHQELQADI